MQWKRQWFRPGARIRAVAQLASLPFFSRRPRAEVAGDTVGADRRPALLRSAEASGAVFSIVVSLTLTALVLALVLAVAQELRQPSTYLEPFSVPPDLHERGYTSAVVTERVLDEIRLIQARSLTSKSRQGVDAAAAQIDMQVPLGQMSVKSLVRYARHALGLPDLRLSGEITRDGNGYAVRVRSREGNTVRLGSLRRSDEVEPLLRSGAEEVLGLVDPFVLAAYHAAMEPVAGGRPQTLATIRSILLGPNPNEKPWALNLWALVLNEEGRRDEAVMRWREALSLDPALLPAITNLANALVRQGRIDEAMDLVDRRVALPMDKAALAQLGHLYWNGGRFDQALQLFDARLREDPGQRLAMLDRGWLLFEAKRSDEADAALAALMKAHPPAAANMQGYGRITRWLAERGDIDAVRVLPPRLEMLNLGRRDSTPAFSRTVLALVDNDPVRARNEAVAAVTIDVGVPVRELAGHVFLATGDPDTAIKYYAQVLQDSPLHIDARLGMAWAQGELGQGPAGLALTDTVLRMAPLYPMAHAVRGRLLRQLKREAEAMASFAEARRLLALRKLPPASLLVRAVEAASAPWQGGG